MRAGTDKPFECVGEAGESRAALAALGDRRDWREHAVVRALLPGVERRGYSIPRDIAASFGPAFHSGGAPHERMEQSAWVDGRVAILGIGREGQAARRYLRTVYPAIQLTLVAEAAPDQDFLEQLSENDHLLTGPLAEAGLENFDILIRSPGISPYRNSIQRACAAGASLTTPSNLWFAAHPEPEHHLHHGDQGEKHHVGAAGAYA